MFPAQWLTRCGGERWSATANDTPPFRDETPKGWATRILGGGLDEVFAAAFVDGADELGDVLRAGAGGDEEGVVGFYDDEAIDA